MTSLVRVDVVICTYNRAGMLDCALEAFGRQRMSPNVEWAVLVVDNNCTDDTAAVVERHRSAGLCVSIVLEPEQGLTAARRRGVEATTAPWIAFVDDDCLVDEVWIDGVAQFVREHADCGAFGGRVILDWEREPPDYVRHFPWAYASQDLGSESARVGLLVGAGMVVRRAALEQSGWIAGPLLADRIANRLVSGGDVEIALRVGAAHELWYVPTFSLRHVISRDRTSFGYLRHITFGLGSCKFFEDSMLWPGSYRRWLAVSVLRARTFARRAVRDACQALRGRRSAADALIRLSFVSGWFAGMWQLALKDADERRAILGCAVPGASVVRTK